MIPEIVSRDELKRLLDERVVNVINRCNDSLRLAAEDGNKFIAFCLEMDNNAVRDRLIDILQAAGYGIFVACENSVPPHYRLEISW